MAARLENPTEKHIRNRVAAAKWRSKNRERCKVSAKKYYIKNKEQCNKSTILSRKKNPVPFTISAKRFAKKSREENPSLWLFYSCKRRAKKRGLEFNIEQSDIVVPAVCPALGIPIFKGYAKKTSNHSPSVDRKDNTKGYIKGNVNVISLLANRIKTNATSAQIRKVADWLDLND